MGVRPNSYGWPYEFTQLFCAIRDCTVSANNSVALGRIRGEVGSNRGHRAQPLVGVRGALQVD